MKSKTHIALKLHQPATHLIITRLAVITKRSNFPAYRRQRSGPACSLAADCAQNVLCAAHVHKITFVCICSQRPESNNLLYTSDATNLS